MSSDHDKKHFDTEHLKRDLGRRTVIGALLTAAGQGSKSLLLMASTVVLARLLTPDDFGLVGMVTAVIGFVSMFKDLGLSQATIQRETINHEQITALFWVNLGLSSLVMVVTALLAPVIAWFYGEVALTGITLGLAGTALLGGLTVQHQALLRRQMRYGSLAAIEVVGLAVQVGVSIALAALGWGYWALVGGRLAFAAANLVGVWIVCDWRPGRYRKPSAEARAMVAFGGNLTGFNVVNYFARNLDDMLIGKFAGRGALGLYQKAYELMMLPLKQVNQPIGRVALPALSRLQDDPDRYRTTYIRLLQTVLLITYPLAAFLVIAADWVVLVVLGDQWVGASALLRVMGILLFTQPVSNSTGWLFLSQNRSGEMFRWGLVGSSLAVLSFLVGLPWGVFGVAASYSISGVVVRTPMVMWWIGRRGPVQAMDIARTVAVPAFGAAVAAGALVALRALGPIEVAGVGMAISLPLAFLAFLCGVMVWPSGRAALGQVRLFLRNLPRGKPPEDAGSGDEENAAGEGG